MPRQTPSLRSSCRLASLAALTACTPLGVTAEAGYTRVALRGDLALADAGGTRTAQSIESAFGLGDERGAPFVRGELDLGTPVLRASWFWLRETGSGVLETDFGGLPAGTEVAAELDLGVGKLTAGIPIDVGPIRLAPGLQLDVFDLDFSARETLLGNREEIDEVLVVPMLHLGAEAALGPLSARGDIGFLEVPSIDGNRGQFLDAELGIAWRPVPNLQLTAGYRVLGIDAKGESNDDAIAVDLLLDGWTIGMGLRF